MSKNVAVIQNPLVFMTESYLKNKVLLNEYENTKIVSVLKTNYLIKFF